MLIISALYVVADGLCSVDADLVWGKSSCWSSEQLIGRGGVTVLRECVGQGEGPNTGGVARRIGTSINLTGT